MFFSSSSIFQHISNLRSYVSTFSILSIRNSILFFFYLFIIFLHSIILFETIRLISSFFFFFLFIPYTLDSSQLFLYLSIQPPSKSIDYLLSRSSSLLLCPSFPFDPIHSTILDSSNLAHFVFGFSSRSHNPIKENIKEYILTL